MVTSEPENGASGAQRDEHRIDVVISTLLRTGVSMSLSVVVVGTIISFLHHPDYVSSHAQLERLTAPGAAFPHTVSELLAGLRAFQGRSITVVGLLMLVCTPVLRVAVSIGVFARQRDLTFVLITATVLGLLALSLVLGQAHG